jgi:hypothetical protein
MRRGMSDDDRTFRIDDVEVCVIGTGDVYVLAYTHPHDVDPAVRLLLQPCLADLFAQALQEAADHAHEISPCEPDNPV